jgi:hypothetical protein
MRSSRAMTTIASSFNVARSLITRSNWRARNSRSTFAIPGLSVARTQSSLHEAPAKVDLVAPLAGEIKDLRPAAPARFARP